MPDTQPVALNASQPATEAIASKPRSRRASRGKLGLSVDRLRAEMRRGVVYGVAERGVGEDAGRLRLTFRYRARSWTVAVEADGTLNEA
jgi:Family of unknown function (DUF6522)